jgi:hypothetical protein
VRRMVQSSAEASLARLPRLSSPFPHRTSLFFRTIAVNGIFNGYVICVHPAFKSGELSAKGDPYGGYTGGEKEMFTYLQSKPELAQRASGIAMQAAASNPQAAMSFMAAAQGAK